MNAMPPVDLFTALEAALEDAGRTHTPGDVAQQVMQGQARILTSPDGRAFAVLEVLEYPRARALRVWLAGGRVRALLSLLPYVEEIARNEGCERLVAIGRAGWLPLAKRHGWKASSLVYTKELEP